MPGYPRVVGTRDGSRRYATFRHQLAQGIERQVECRVGKSVSCIDRQGRVAGLLQYRSGVPVDLTAFRLCGVGRNARRTMTLLAIGLSCNERCGHLFGIGCACIVSDEDRFGERPQRMKGKVYRAHGVS